jgi:SAM-dependent methyltransferase
VVHKLARVRSKLRQLAARIRAPAPVSAFHSDEYLRHNARRLEHLATLGLALAGRSVLEVGAGIGDHTSFFVDRGCQVTSSDGRPENVALLAKRFPALSVRLLNLDDPDQAFTTQAEVVYCYGTLYHLRRPAEALEYLAARCSSSLLLETCVSRGDDERLELVEEPQHNPSQATSGTGCRPTRLWVHRRLEELFPFVYMPLTQPAHPEFPLDWTTEPAADTLTRAIYVVTREPVDSPLLSPSIPQQQRYS